MKKSSKFVRVRLDFSYELDAETQHLDALPGLGELMRTVEALALAFNRGAAHHSDPAAFQQKPGVKGVAPGARLVQSLDTRPRDGEGRLKTRKT